jgi:hypothetical protein
MAPKSATNTIARGACAEDGNPAKNKNPASILSVFVSVVASILGVSPVLLATRSGVLASILWYRILVRTQNGSPVFCQYGSPVFS